MRALVMELVQGETHAESMKNVAPTPGSERIVRPGDVRPGGLTYPL